jgi:alkanesulfonate monooxygenase SsuD/methylene tetrahydromethanopterin reductase-like flavin-dependent oxidoreductase (luciferase family)
MVANNPLSLDAAADEGLPVFMNGAMRIVDLDQAMARYRARAAAAGFAPDTVDIPVNRFVFVGESRAHAHRVMQGPFLQFLERRAPDLKGYLATRFGGRTASFEVLAREVCIFDDPEGCAARLYEIEDRVGLRHTLCTFNLITLDHRLALESMRRFAAEVVPLLAEKPAPSLPPASLAPQSRVRIVGDVARPGARAPILPPAARPLLRVG